LLRAALAIAVACVVAAGCRQGDDELRRHRRAAEQRTLAASLDRLEDRLMVDQARVHFWQEMRNRHESVTALACVSQELHAPDIAQRLGLQPDRHTPARRVARFEPAAADGPVSRPPASALGRGGP
jgi:hypothetical protein